MEAFADADAADIANFEAADARAFAQAATSHAITAATAAQSSSLRAAHVVNNLARGMFRSAIHRGVQLRATAVAGDMTQQANIDINAAQAEIVNPTPPQVQIPQEVAWHSTLNPTAAAQDTTSEDGANAGEEAVEVASPEHAVEDAALEHAAGDANPPAPDPVTEAAAAAPAAAITGILSRFPSLTFPWPAQSCHASNLRAAQMRDRYAANNH